jgi:uncharacterized protein YyaL (SSP411 family)
MASPSKEYTHTNRLAQATSPYLLQHAHNPVDWYPWGREAIEAARMQDKPIFLSVGYSACYWCHVMERECFENEQIAGEMNDKFICIKVDREERPDVDQLYMTAVQILTRQGGWPMSVFLTPGLKPFFGGTYFPPGDSHGRPGFPRVLNSISAAYHTKREQVERSADEIVRMLEKVAEPRQPIEPLRVDADWVESLIERSTADYEQCFGGFGGAPKFPRQTLLETLLVYTASPHATDDAQQIKAQVLYTLDFMAEGGIRDQLGGGFHRYSTDEKWLVPHFEIMLYDNAMLAVVYTQVWQQTQNPAYAKIARGILDFVLREMTSPQGAFYTAFDAEVDAQEGLSYLWTESEVHGVLSSPSPGTPGEGRGEGLGASSTRGFSDDDITLFLRTYGLSAGPNFADPHHGTGQPDKNILFLPTPLAAVAKSLNVTEEQLDLRLAPMREALYAARRKRKQPMLDTKILTSWNALMIRAFAIAGKSLGDARYVDAAAKGARFMSEQHRLADGALIRTSRPDSKTKDADSREPIPGFLDDYAFFARALLALHAATGDDTWKVQARETIDVMKRKFLDRELGGFYFTPAEATDLIVRQKTASDSPLPSGNAVAAMCLLELGEPDIARQVLAVFAQSLEDQAEGMSSMVGVALEYLHHHEPFTVSTAGEADGDRPLTPDQLAKAAVELLAEWESPTRLRVAMEVMETYHVNANRAVQGMIPTTLAVAGPHGADVGVTVEYPPGEERKFDFASEAIQVYEGVVVLLAELGNPLPPGTALRVVATYQACTEEACLAATSKEIQVVTP